MELQPPYYAVIFSSKYSDKTSGYKEMAIAMKRIAKMQEGFLGLESARETIGITISYWSSLEAIKKWKQNTDHIIAQNKGKKEWYIWYKVRICKVERDYEFFKQD